MSEVKTIQISMDELRRNTEITHGKDGDKNVVSAIVSHSAFPNHLYQIQVIVDPEKIDFYNEEGEHVHLQVRRRNLKSYPRNKEYEDVWPTNLRTLYCTHEEIWEKGYQIIRSNLVDVWKHTQKQREVRHKKQMREVRAAHIANGLYQEMICQVIQASKGEEDENTNDAQED